MLHLIHYELTHSPQISHAERKQNRIKTMLKNMPKGKTGTRTKRAQTQERKGYFPNNFTPEQILMEPKAQTDQKLRSETNPTREAKMNRTCTSHAPLSGDVHGSSNAIFQLGGVDKKSLELNDLNVIKSPIDPKASISRKGKFNYVSLALTTCMILAYCI